MTSVQYRVNRYPIKELDKILQLRSDESELLAHEIDHNISLSCLRLICVIINSDKKIVSFSWSKYDAEPYRVLLDLCKNCIQEKIDRRDLLDSLLSRKRDKPELRDSHYLILDVNMSVKKSQFQWRWKDDYLNIAGAEPVQDLYQTITGFPNREALESAAAMLPVKGKRYACVDTLTMKNSNTVSAFKCVNDEHRICSNTPQRVEYHTSWKLNSEKPEVAPRTRKKIPAAVRHEVWAKFSDRLTGKCFVCEAEISIRSYHCAHKVPAARGGPDTVDNLYPTCSHCNLSMATMDLGEYIKKYYPKRYQEIKW